MNKNIKYSQNFLTSEKVLNQIIKQLNLKETDTVYEIGTAYPVLRLVTTPCRSRPTAVRCYPFPPIR